MNSIFNAEAQGRYYPEGSGQRVLKMRIKRGSPRMVKRPTHASPKAMQGRQGSGSE